MADIEIRPVSELSDIHQIEEIQRITWNMDEVEIIPARFIHALHEHGACLLGAYDGDKVVGFVLGVLGTDDEGRRKDKVAAARLIMYSAIMGVLPEYQVGGLGYRLKLGQREFALRIGVRLISWTYDPLESRNGYLNIGKLGVVCQRYLRNFHGDMGGINAGLPTDRFSVDWWVTANRVKARLSQKRGPLGLDAFLGGGALLVNEAEHREQGLPVPTAEPIESEQLILLIEIPADFQRMKRLDMALAQSWRAHTRQLFEHYFGRGYVVTDFLRHRESEGFYRSFYVLTRQDG